MRRRRPPRRQRVALRDRRRVAMRGVALRALRAVVVFAVLTAVGAAMVTRGGPALESRLSALAPRMEIQGPEAVRGLNLDPSLPARRLWLWLPGMGIRVEKQILAAHPALARAEIDRDWESKRIVVKLTPRQALARVKGQALDAEGVVYRPLSGDLSTVPQLELFGSAARPMLGRWIKAMRQQQALWPKIVTIREDRDGLLHVTLQSGLELIWGTPEAAEVGAKAQVLFKVLEDAAAHFKGTARADLRFFSEGRIIVTPLKK